MKRAQVVVAAASEVCVVHGRSDAIDFNEPDEGIVYVCLCER